MAPQVGLRAADGNAAGAGRAHHAGLAGFGLDLAQVGVAIGQIQIDAIAQGHAETLTS